MFLLFFLRDVDGRLWPFFRRDRLNLSCLRSLKNLGRDECWHCRGAPAVWLSTIISGNVACCLLYLRCIVLELRLWLLHLSQLEIVGGLVESRILSWFSRGIFRRLFFKVFEFYGFVELGWLESGLDSIYQVDFLRQIHLSLLLPRLIWFFFDCYSVQGGRVWHPSFEIEDVSLNTTKGVVITHVEPSSVGQGLSCLACLLKNLNLLRAHRFLLGLCVLIFEWLKWLCLIKVYFIIALNLQRSCFTFDLTVVSRHFFYGLCFV